MNRVRWRRVLTALALTGALGCDDSNDTQSATDMATPDMGTLDMATPDMATPDMGTLDMGTPDMATPDMATPSGDVETAADWLTGDFSSRTQAMADRRYFDVHLFAVQIWPEREDGVWMYVQQSRDDNDDGTYEPPYRQRIYHVHGVDEAVISSVYRIAGEAAYVDPWRDLTVLDGLSAEHLEPATGCDVTLNRDGASFVGGTQGTDCTLSFGGYATSAVTLTAEGIQSLDLLYDEAGNIINGLTEASTPYTFEKHENFPIE